MKIAVATSNPHKLKEIQYILKDLNIEIVPAEALGIDFSHVEESGETLEENALIKARYVWKRTGLPSMADDTGLFVRALDGLPGVRSARFAGDNATDEENVEKLLNLMKGKKDREAFFKTVIAFIDGERREYLFEGKVHGIITEEPAGERGFGYDPVFFYPPMKKTFAQMTPEEKNSISHRYRALESFREFLWKRLSSSTGTGH